MRKKYLFLLLFAISLSTALIFNFGCAKKKPPAFEADYDVIIVGGGMAGLSAGAHLSNAGLKVLLLEQHHKVGGCTTNFTRGDFTFEVALHEMNRGDLGTVMKLCGVYDKVDIYELPDFYRSIYPTVDVDIIMPTTWEEWDNTLKERWPEEAAGIEKFHELSSTTYSDILAIKDLYRYTGFKAFKTKMSVPLKHKSLMTWSKKTLTELMDECFTDEGLKAVVSQLWVYYGAPANDQLALLTLAATDAFLSDSVWHIKGTSQALANAYKELIEENKGVVKTGTLVTEIIIEDGLARGVKTEYGDVYTSRYVLANTDPYQLVFKLAGEENFPKKYVERIKSLKPANSLFVTYLGLNIDLKKLGYTDTEIFYNTSTDTTLVYKNMMEGNFAEGMASITIYSNYGDPIYAPKGKSVVALLEYSDYDIWPKDRKEYQKMKEEKAWELINLAANVIPELKDKKNIEVMEIMTPVTIEEFTKNYHGIPYGFYLDTEQWEKIPNNTPIDNLFIAGSWTKAWHGVGPAQINGYMGSRLILDMEGIE
ncbi:MAG: NAD(P)/FAD-dependent oxidoreductase [Deltaproteobacteria bacterium]|uniref:NAD(P)/FAD-dependent oxidoreductase n=1 Tax=Candidatus Zymogenus saltonus TaxID=2844893 RepID=A0A9D8PMU7_9DELT|nr:NAD(P)/FAD-dependent oxidoreductase [Candidatus Zymogenus saltonus]